MFSKKPKRSSKKLQSSLDSSQPRINLFFKPANVSQDSETKTVSNHQLISSGSENQTSSSKNDQNVEDLSKLQSLVSHPTKIVRQDTESPKIAKVKHDTSTEDKIEPKRKCPFYKKMPGKI